MPMSMGRKLRTLRIVVEYPIRSIPPIAQPKHERKSRIWSAFSRLPDDIGIVKRKQTLIHQVPFP